MAEGCLRDGFRASMRHCRRYFAKDCQGSQQHESRVPGLGACIKPPIGMCPPFSLKTFNELLHTSGGS